MDFLTLLNSEAFTSSSVFLAIVGLAIVDLILKGWAMWRAALLHKKGWFVALLIVNSAGILPAIYLFLSQKEYVARFGASKK